MDIIYVSPEVQTDSKNPEHVGKCVVYFTTRFEGRICDREKIFDTEAKAKMCIVKLLEIQMKHDKYLNKEVNKQYEINRAKLQYEGV